MSPERSRRPYAPTSAAPGMRSIWPEQVPPDWGNSRWLNFKRPLGVQKELMRHASIQTTMNIYGKAMSDSKRDANTNVVKMILKSKKTDTVVVQSTQIAATES